MAPALKLTQWWKALQQRFTGTALVAGASSPGGDRHHWSTGSLSDQLVTPSTTFYAGSVTKQLTAALVARAVLDGQVDRQTSVRAFLPALPAWTTPICVPHLLHHTAGLPQPGRLAVALGYSDDAVGWSRLDNESLLAALQRVPPPAEPPGLAFRYDNTGYVLLAEVLRAVRGRDVSELARSELFAPLGLGGSRLGGPAPVLLPGQPGPAATVGDGGLWTCLADLLTWLEAMNADRLGVDLTALVQTPGRLDDGTLLDYSWGIGPRPGPSGTCYLHGGEWPGWCAMTVRCPAAGTAVAVLAATEDMATISAAALELHDLLMTPAA